MSNGLSKIAVGKQLPLPFGERPLLRFSFYQPGPNAEAYSCLFNLCDTGRPEYLYLWGVSGSGKTHLLQAVCQRATELDKQAVYLPMSGYREWTPEMFEGLEELDFVCLDELDSIAGEPEWELALFALFNRLQDNRRPLIVAARENLPNLPLKLPDLRSRIAWGSIFHLQTLDDDGKLQVLQLRAQAKGFTLADPVARYLLTHAHRDLPTLCELLDTLDTVSLSAHRRLTLPFVRTWLKNLKDDPAITRQ